MEATDVGPLTVFKEGMPVVRCDVECVDTNGLNAVVIALTGCSVPPSVLLVGEMSLLNAHLEMIPKHTFPGGI